MKRLNADRIATASVNGTAVDEQTALIHEADAGLSSTSERADEVYQDGETLRKDPPGSVQIRDRVKEFRRVRASELVRNPKNWRRHPKSQVAALRGLLSEVGYAAALLVRELPDGRLMIIDGHMRAETTPDQVVPVLVLNVTEKEADKILLTHDPLGAMAESDAARIKALLATVQTEDQAVQDLLKYTAGERLWAVLHPDEVREAEISPNRADELRETWGVEPGQVWQAEAHRIICGDSRKRRNLEKLGAEPFRLIVTDPPYGVNYAAKNKYLNSSDRGTRIQKPIENDGLPPSEVKALFEASVKEAVAFALPGAACYATVPSGPLLPYFIAGFEGAGLSFKHLLVWLKQQFVIGLSDYHYRHEAILYGWVENGPHYFINDRTQDSVFEIDRPLVSDLHPTTKPVELLARMIANSSLPGEFVYDPFCGSGSTIVAAHQLGRVAYACEIDPGYVAVVLERLSMLGLRPKLVSK
jgi:DNA modification methylase